MTGDLLVDRQGDVAWVTMNRPKRLNALSRRLTAELRTTLVELRGAAVKVMVLTGTDRDDGRPCFSAGVDVKEIQQSGPTPRFRPGVVGAIEAFGSTDPLVGDELQLLFDELEGQPFITIAAVDGVCAGGGLALALACDLRVVSTTAVIEDLHVQNLGRPGHAVASRLVKALGPARAKEMMLTGEPLAVGELTCLGLANRVVEPETLHASVDAIAQRIAGREHGAIRMTKAAADAAVDLDRRSALRFASVCWAALGGGDPAAYQSIEKGDP